MRLQVTGLRAGYRENVTVIDDITLTVDGGAIGVIGRNGSGKTCLAQALSGALGTSSGQSSLDGYDISAMTSRQRIRAGICLVPEGRLVFGQLTVQENLHVAAYAIGRKAGRAADLEALFPILGKKRNDRAASLSGGEQQLLAIGRALIQKPKLLILDEPSLGLSPIAIENLAQVLASVRDELNVSMVLMEQNSELLTTLCGEVLLLDEGRVTQRLDMNSAKDQRMLVNSYLGV